VRRPNSNTWTHMVFLAREVVSDGRALKIQNKEVKTEPCLRYIHTTERRAHTYIILHARRRRPLLRAHNTTHRPVRATSRRRHGVPRSRPLCTTARDARASVRGRGCTRDLDCERSVESKQHRTLVYRLFFPYSRRPRWWVCCTWAPPPLPEPRAGLAQHVLVRDV
jgi:hypothetical protein